MDPAYILAGTPRARRGPPHTAAGAPQLPGLYPTQTLFLRISFDLLFLSLEGGFRSDLSGSQHRRHESRHESQFPHASYARRKPTCTSALFWQT